MIGAFGEVPVTENYSYRKTVTLGWVCILLFGFCGIMWARRIAQVGEELRISPSGIRWVPWSDQTIPWSEIRDVGTWTSEQGIRTIVLHLYNPRAYPGRGFQRLMRLANKMFVGGDIHLSLASTDRSLDEAMAAINRFRHM